MVQQRFLQADGADHVIETSCLIANIVLGLTCFNVLVIWTAVENNVAFDVGIAGI